jgi:hypothetical protein
LFATVAVKTKRAVFESRLRFQSLERLLVDDVGFRACVDAEFDALASRLLMFELVYFARSLALSTNFGHTSGSQKSIK